MFQIFERPSSQAATREAGHMTFKVTKKKGNDGEAAGHN
jgi:hypothetical protein